METNWDRYFGTPEKASESLSRLVDRYDAMCRGEEYEDEFTDHFGIDGDCAYGLIHQDTLTAWLRQEWGGERKSEFFDFLDQNGM